MRIQTKPPGGCSSYLRTALLLLTASVALSACGRTETSAPATAAKEPPASDLPAAAVDDAGTQPARAWVTGTVIYRQRIALAPEALVTVRLVDSSTADAPVEVLAEAAIPTAGRQVPIPFELAYDAAQIDPRRRYAIEARITVGDELLFTTRETFHVITDGNPASIAVRVDPTG